MRRLLVAATAAAALVVPAPAQADPPFAQSPGCAHFAEGGAQQILQNPAFEAFVKQFAHIGGIGPCFAPHPGGRG